MELLVKANLLATIAGSIDSQMFQKTLILSTTGVIEDITDGGRFSCAKYVTGILLLNSLIKKIHVTVEGAVEDMKNSGWYLVYTKSLNLLMPGTVILWEQRLGSDSKYHKHIGFFVGESEAVSNDTHCNVPRRHHLTFGTKDGMPKRQIIAIYVHPILFSNQPAI